MNIARESDLSILTRKTTIPDNAMSFEDISAAYDNVIAELNQLPPDDVNYSKLLTWSTGHLSKHTRSLLSDPEFYAYDLPIYPKGTYGWFLYLDGIELTDDLPEDIKTCIRQANKWRANVLCFDSDGEILPSLPFYG